MSNDDNGEFARQIPQRFASVAPLEAQGLGEKSFDAECSFSQASKPRKKRKPLGERLDS